MPYNDIDVSSNQPETIFSLVPYESLPKGQS